MNVQFRKSLRLLLLAQSSFRVYSAVKACFITDRVVICGSTVDLGAVVVSVVVVGSVIVVVSVIEGSGVVGSSVGGSGSSFGWWYRSEYI